MLVYKREPKSLFHNLTQLVFGGHVDPTDPTHGEVHYPDLPMLGTLLIANLRTGRFVDMLRVAGAQLVVYEDQGPTDAATGNGGAAPARRWSTRTARSSAACRSPPTARCTCGCRR